MNLKIKGILLLVYAACVVLLTVFFFSKSQPIEASAPVFTESMVQQWQAQKMEEEQKKRSLYASRTRSETESWIYRCDTNEQCIIVDKDPCGCLKGPSGVTAINAEWSLEFSKLMDKEYAQASSCPFVASTERECSATARAVCTENRCQIVW